MVTAIGSLVSVVVAAVALLLMRMVAPMYMLLPPVSSIVETDETFLTDIVLPFWLKPKFLLDTVTE